eukprot:915876-Lingulodinium_polyedra.AAC.1
MSVSWPALGELQWAPRAGRAVFKRAPGPEHVRAGAGSRRQCAKCLRQAVGEAGKARWGSR